MQLSRRDALLGAGAFLLLAVAIVRTATPDRSRIRRLSVEAIDIESEPISPARRSCARVHGPRPTTST